MIETDRVVNFLATNEILLAILNIVAFGSILYFAFRATVSFWRFGRSWWNSTLRATLVANRFRERRNAVRAAQEPSYYLSVNSVSIARMVYLVYVGMLAHVLIVVPPAEDQWIPKEEVGMALMVVVAGWLVMETNKVVLRARFVIRVSNRAKRAQKSARRQLKS